MTTDDLAVLLVSLLKGGHGTVQLTYRSPVTEAKGPPVWIVEARGQHLAATFGMHETGATLAEVLAKLPKPTTAR